MYDHERLDLMTASEIVQFLTALFSIANPIGNSMVFLTLTENRTPSEQRKIAITTAYSIITVLLIATWGGSWILKMFNISIGAFEAAGSFVLFFIGFSMLQSKQTTVSQTEQELKQATHKNSIAIVPLAIPIIAGPGTIVTTMLAAARYPHLSSKFILSVCEIVIGILIGAILVGAGHLKNIIGETGRNIIVRVMGLIIMSVAVGMFRDALTRLFPHLF